MIVTKLEPNQIFVFGSNLNGHHAGGAARQAYEQFGAEWGQGAGLQGKSYAVPTLDENMEKMKLSTIAWHLQNLKYVAMGMPDTEFLLTKLGQGIAGFSKEEIENILPDFPKNVIKIDNWQ